MADLNSYVEQVLDEEDKVLVREASSCLEAEAFRAAYITLWLSAAEAIRRKFVNAATYDHRAAEIVGEITQREGEHRAVDAFLISQAKDYGLISDADATRLRHIYENRNIFGHPYEERPSQQLVETAAAEAVAIVLAQPLALRHGYLSRQVTRLTSDRPFLNDDRETVENYARLVHTRSAPDLRVWFLRKLVAALDPVFGDASLDLLQRRGQWFLRAFLLADTTVFGEWDVANDLPEHPRVLPLVLSQVDVFPHLSDHPQDIVVNTLLEEAVATPPRLRLVLDLEKVGALRPTGRQALSDRIMGLPLSRLMISDLPFEAYWQRVITGLESYSWDSQNEAIRPLQQGGPQALQGMDDAAQEELGRNVFQAAEGNAFSVINFLGAVGSGDDWPIAFIRGVSLEPFANENGELRLKTSQLKRAMRALGNSPEDERSSILDQLLALIAAGEAENPYWFRITRDEAVPILRELSTTPGQERFAQIAEALEAVDAGEPDD